MGTPRPSATAGRPAPRHHHFFSFSSCLCLCHLSFHSTFLFPFHVCLSSLFSFYVCWCLYSKFVFVSVLRLSLSLWKYGHPAAKRDRGGTGAEARPSLCIPRFSFNCTCVYRLSSHSTFVFVSILRSALSRFYLCLRRYFTFLYVSVLRLSLSL